MAKWVMAFSSRGREVVVFNTKMPRVDAVGPAAVIHVGPEPLPSSPLSRMAAYLAAARRLRTGLKNFDLTCVQWIDSNPSMLGVLAAPGMVAAPWGSDMFVSEGWLRRSIKRRVLTRARVVVTGSEFLARQADIVAGRSLPLFSIFHCVPMDLFTPKKRGPRSGSGVRFGIAKHLVPLYGHDHLVAAFARVVAEDPASRLVILGDGPTRPALEQQVAGLGIGDRVEFPGRYAPERMPEFYASIDVSLSPSVLATDALGGTIPESLAAGVPVIATRVGGSAEAVIPGVTGFLVPPGDDEAMAAAMLEVIGLGPGGLERLAASSRVWAEEHLDMVKDVGRLEERVLGSS